MPTILTSAKGAARIGINIKAGIIEKGYAKLRKGDPSLAHVSRDDVRRAIAFAVECALEITAGISPPSQSMNSNRPKHRITEADADGFCPYLRGWPRFPRQSELPRSSPSAWMCGTMKAPPRGANHRHLPMPASKSLMCAMTAGAVAPSRISTSRIETAARALGLCAHP